MNSNALKALSWFGMFTTVAGSYSMSWGHYFAGFVLLFAGSVAWAIIGYVTKQWAMLAMQVTLFASEIIGIWRNM